jgi:glycosyltransferase involved in cell wall biosynthesis
LKLLFISTEKGWHGGEEQLRLLVTGAVAAGHDCCVATREASIVAERIGATGANVLELPRSIRGLRSIWQLRRHLKRFQPDVIHANDPHALSLQRTASWALSIPARICSRRVLFPIFGTRKYRAGCDRMVCVSHAIANVCRESRIPEKMLAVVHDGADPARVQAGDGRRGRAALGLVDAMPAVLARHPQAVLVLAGDGPLREDLMTQSRALGLDGAVRILGYRDDVPDLIHACDVFALASPEEGLGTSVLDATFAGRSVVAAEAGGIPEMLRDGAGESCGWLVAPRDPAALARGINEALASPEERARRVALAQNWAADEFTAARMVSRTLAVYAEVIG